MSDVVPEAEAQRTWQDIWPMQRLPLAVVPPLATLSALAAFASMVMNQIVLPSLGNGVHSPHFARVAQAGRFTANLAATTGLITLVSCVSWTLMGRPKLPLRRQLFTFTSAGLLAYVTLAALLFPGNATREQIYFGVVSANVIGMSVGSAAISSVRGALLRAMAVGITALAALSTFVIVLEFVPDAQLDPWARQAALICKAAGEAIYLALLIAAFPLLVPRGLRARELFARSVGFAVLVLAIYALRTAQHALNNDYGLLLYSAQRVSLFLDRWPLAYALPVCLVLSATTTALLSGGSARIQAAAGLLLIFSAGYATRAPGRLLSLTVGFMLLARALVAFTDQAPFRSIVPPPPGKLSVPPRADDEDS
jgi:hypothetical protein